MHALKLNFSIKELGTFFKQMIKLTNISVYLSAKLSKVASILLKCDVNHNYMSELVNNINPSGSTKFLN